LTSASGSFRGEYAWTIGGATTIATSAQSQAYGYYAIDLANAGVFASNSSYTNAYFFMTTTAACFPKTNVGIGTASPASQLHLFSSTASSSSSPYTALTLMNTNAGNAGASVAIDISTYNTVGYAPGARIAGIDNNYASDIAFLTKTQGALVNGLVERMRIAGTGNVGIGTNSPGYPLHVNGTSRFGATIMTDTINVSGANFINFGSDVTKEPNAGKMGYQIFTTNALDIVGAGTGTRTVKIWDNLTVPGSISKGSGTFDIEHPLYSDRRLVHSFIEGPRCDLIYRGKTTLINGTAVVDINKECTHSPECAMDDGTFEALCGNPQIFLQNNQSFDRVRGAITGSRLTITCENPVSIVIEWMVIAERIDPFIKQWDRTNSDGYLVTQYTMAHDPLTMTTNSSV
jgi:hypothetical protein